jgi:hypothetical protein
MKQRATAGSIAIAVFVAAQIFAGSAFAQQTDAERVRDLERKLEKSLQMIDELTRRVNDLERGGRAPASPLAPAAPNAPAPAPAQEARIEALEKSLSQMSRGDLGVPVHGFFDVGYEHSTQAREDNRKSGFVLGNLDFFLTPSFGRIKTLAELVFEITDEGGLATDLERVQIGYTVSDSLTVWMGRFHTPYGYWNAAFHHGAQIQTAITRPRFVDFEDKGGILPAHAVGVWATGQARAGAGKIHYDAYLANGNRVVDSVLDFQAHRDDNSNKMFGFNVGYLFGGALDGLTLGIHGLQQDVNIYQEAAPIATTRLAFTGGYGYLEMGNWEGIGEYYRFRNKDLTGGTGTHSSWAGFLQLGYTFADFWTPYYRWEKTQLDQADLYFAAQDSGRSYQKHSAGVRFHINPNTVFKIEGNRTREYLGETQSYSEARAQFAVRF